MVTLDYETHEDDTGEHNMVVQIGVDEDGEPRALVETDHQEIRTWATDTLDDYKRQATTLSQTPRMNRLEA